MSRELKTIIFYVAAGILGWTIGWVAFKELRDWRHQPKPVAKRSGIHLLMLVPKGNDPPPADYEQHKREVIAKLEGKLPCGTTFVFERDDGEEYERLKKLVDAK